MKKRILAVLMTFCMALSLLPEGVLAEGTTASGTCGENLTWVLDADTETLTISGTGPMTDFDGTAPWNAGHGIYSKRIIIEPGATSIGTYAFASLSFEEISIPDTVEKIGDYAFSNSSNSFGEMEIELPASVTAIGNEVFTNCEKLMAIHVAEDNPKYCDVDGVLYDKARKSLLKFPSAKVGSYAVPEGVTRIAGDAFAMCTQLTEVTIPDTVTAMGGGATFFGCSSLVSVSLPKQIGDWIDNSMFGQCTNLANIVIPDGVKYIGNSAFYQCTSLKSVEFPDSLTHIYIEAFRGCTELTEADLPDGLIFVDSYAFAGTGMTDVDMPESLVKVGVCAFGYDDGSSHGNVEGVRELNLKSADNGMVRKEGFSVKGSQGAMAEIYAGQNQFRFVRTGTVKMSFGDVTDIYSWVYLPVLWAVNTGITKGVSETEFSPAQSCTRAQAVTFLWRAAGNPEPKSASNPFADVAADQYYYKAVLWAVEQGITNGISATAFGPDITCNRAQIVTFLYRYEGTPAATGGGFSDVPASEYYYAPVIWAVSKGVTNGVSATEFGPGNDCTRGQIVTFLYRDMVG